VILPDTCELCAPYDAKVPLVGDVRILYRHTRSSASTCSPLRSGTSSQSDDEERNPYRVLGNLTREPLARLPDDERVRRSAALRETGAW